MVVNIRKVGGRYIFTSLFCGHYQIYIFIEFVINPPILSLTLFKVKYTWLTWSIISQI